jgi:hypothetical protein
MVPVAVAVAAAAAVVVVVDRVERNRHSWRC